MKILLGGTFDPLHYGHLKLALAVSKAFAEPVAFLPLSGTPSYKSPPQATLNQRVAMLKLVIAEYPQQLKLDLSETAYPNYSPSYLTLTRMRANEGSSTAISFIIGSDSLISLSSWEEWRSLFQLSNFIVALRPDYPLAMMPAELAAEVLPRLSKTLNIKQSAGQVVVFDFVPTTISSTLIRNASKEQKDISELVPAVVHNYINQHKLYTKE